MFIIIQVIQQDFFVLKDRKLISTYHVLYLDIFFLRIYYSSSELTYIPWEGI